MISTIYSPSSWVISARPKWKPNLRVPSMKGWKRRRRPRCRQRTFTQQLLIRGGAPLKKLSSLAELPNDTADFALKGTNIKCQFSLADDLWRAEIDKEQISQVINNLVINAQQTMPTQALGYEQLLFYPPQSYLECRQSSFK
jgi:hypothetical protein